jgi:hypothetical protein
MELESLKDSRGGFQALRQYIRPGSPQERCDLCASPVPPVHQHLLEAASRALICACPACAMLFGTSDSKYRRVPRGIRLLRNFQASDQMWEDLAIPINMAYFCHDSRDGRAKASYPSPAGAIESLLALEAWRDLMDANPILKSLEPDVECLLANRVGLLSGNAEAEYFLAPIDECYKLVGLIRTHWSGLSGGTEVWQQLAEHFASLRERAVVVEAGRA